MHSESWGLGCRGFLRFWYLPKIAYNVLPFKGVYKKRKRRKKGRLPYTAETVSPTKSGNAQRDQDGALRGVPAEGGSGEDEGVAFGFVARGKAFPHIKKTMIKITDRHIHNKKTGSGLLYAGGK